MAPSLLVSIALPPGSPHGPPELRFPPLRKHSAATSSQTRGSFWRLNELLITDAGVQRKKKNKLSTLFVRRPSSPPRVSFVHTSSAVLAVAARYTRHLPSPSARRTGRNGVRRPLCAAPCSGRAAAPGLSLLRGAGPRAAPARRAPRARSATAQRHADSPARAGPLPTAGSGRWGHAAAPSPRHSPAARLGTSGTGTTGFVPEKRFSQIFVTSPGAGYCTGSLPVLFEATLGIFMLE